MSPHYHRALILHAQERYADAKNELHQALVEEPTNAQVHALLAVCLVHLEDYAAAGMEARNAVSLAPTMAWGHYAMAFVAYRRNRLDEALGAIEEALAIDPSSADYYALLAQVRLEQRMWPSALEAAEAGLMHEPEHVGCNNLRAMALVKLGRAAEAGATIDAALRRSPEDADSHANQGWTYLHAREPRKALEHFREALRLEPNHQWARAGIVEALKARFFLYRWLLAYFLWMGRQSGRMQWGIMIGGYVGYRLLLDVARTNPEVGRFLWPLLYAYMAFAVMTWLSYPMFNLLLRLNKFGRYALTPRQIWQSNCIGSLLLLTLVFGVLKWRTDADGWFLLALMCFLLVVPASIPFQAPAGWPRWVAIGVVGALLAVGLYTAGSAFAVERMPLAKQAAGVAGVMQAWEVFLYGTLAWMWGSGLVVGARVKR